MLVIEGFSFAIIFIILLLLGILAITRNLGFENKNGEPNIIEIKNLIGKKYTLKEIAETIKLTEAVVSMQVESLVEFEPSTDISLLIKKEIIREIIEEVKNGYENLKELKERLPSRITYPEIRIALAKFRADSQIQASNAQHKQ